MPPCFRLFSACLLSVCAPFAVAATRSRPIEVKVVVVAMFEQGDDAGDAPGELQYWAERDRLEVVYPLPAGSHPVHMNARGEMAVLTGQGTAHAAATIMALGLDPRFDLSHAYWLIAGIAGASPDRASLGSAVWARWVVDGDMAYEIDARETPPDWSTGYVPLRKTRPYEEPAAPLEGQVFALNAGLAEWAFNLTRSTPLGDSEHLREIRSHFDGVAADRPPFVALGDELSSSTYWHGQRFDAWASEWVNYFTGGKGVFSTTAMEDTGTLESLQLLARAGRVDFNRVLVLRTVSNYDRQPRGMCAAESLAAQRVSKFGAYLPSLESAYRVGQVVVSELLNHGEKYSETVAGAKQASAAKTE